MWRTDCTEVGTQLVFDSKSGPANGSIYQPFNVNETFASASGKIYFLDNTKGLYESDGSLQGTKNIYPVGVSYYLMQHQNKIYFVGRKAFYDSIYVFNPSTNFTKAINYGTRSPRDLITTPLGLLFIDNNKLFKIDSATSTVVELSSSNTLENINIKSAAGYHKGFYYFIAKNYNGGTALNLYRTDGTKSGTQLFLNIGVDNFSSYGRFCSAGNYLYFLFNSGSGKSTELWRTDGTIQGSIKLAEYNGAPLNFITPSNNLVEHNGLIYYFQGIGKEVSLYQSDGSFNGTKAIALINDASTFTQISTGLMKLGNQFLFSADVKGSSIGEELWSYALPVGNSEIISLKNKIVLYPNPTSGNLYLSLDDQILKQLTIVDLSGQILPYENLLRSDNSINLEAYNAGIYFIHIITNRSSTIVRIIKN